MTSLLLGLSSPTGLQFTLETVTLPPSTFSVVSFELREHYSEPYCLTVQLSSPLDTIEASQVLDQKVKFTVWRSGKAKESNSFSNLQIFARIRPLVFSLFCALGLVSTPTLAETLIIQADKSAPKHQQPIILQTANGLPQVNIQTPNDKGLSHNKYSKFDVDTKGAILNNSRTNVQTQQAGWVQGNPYLAKGEAKIILNEVNSNDPSLLKGYVEVAGKKADVIIANPSGIHCQGCGVINSDRATLTTGKPHIQNGNLESFVVEKGKVKVDGKGLDNSRVDYTEILAREVQANAGIWSKKEAKVITGKNIVKRKDTPTDLQIIHSNQPLADEVQPQFAVDIGELGGMYSGKIHLIGTEQGVGVRNAGHIGASSETLTIDSKGRIVNTGTLNANQTINLTATKGIANTGKIENRQGDIQLNTKADIKQDGSIVARQGNIQQHADTTISQQGETVAKGNISYAAPMIETKTDSLIAAGVEITDGEKGENRKLEDKSPKGKSIELTSTGITTVQGKNVASGKIAVSASEITANQSQQSANTIVFNAKSGDIKANKTTWSANDLLDIHTPHTFSTMGSELSAGKWSVLASQVDNQSGRWFGLNDESLKLDLHHGLNNLDGVIQNQGNIEIQAHMAEFDNTRGTIKSLKGSISSQSQTQLLNQQGKLVAEKNVVINHLGLKNQQGYILAQKGNTDIRLHENTLNNQQGNILSGNNLSILSSTLTNLRGMLYAGQTATINTHSGNLNNQEQGYIVGRNIVLNTQNLLNDSGVIEASNNASLTVAQQFDNNKTSSAGSLVQAINTLSIHTQQLNNRDTKTTSSLPESGLVASNLHLITPHLDNQQGGIYTLREGTLHIGRDLHNQRGEIRSIGDLAIAGSTLSVENQQGSLGSLGRLSLTADKLSSFGVISGGDTELNLVKGLDSQTDILGKKTLNITTQGELINHASLHSEGYVTLNAAHIENRATGKIKGGSLIATAQQNLTNRGLINTLSDTVIKVGQTLQNIGTGRIYGDHIALQADTVINEDERVNHEIKSAVIAARERLDIGANHIFNQQNSLKPAEGEKSSVTLSSDGEMAFGQSLDEHNTAVGQAKTLRNTSALIEVGKNLALNVADTLNSNKYIYNVLTEKSKTPVNESYLISGNTLREGERINFNLLKWISFSRAGKVVFKENTHKLTDSSDLAAQVLPMPNEMVCQNVMAQTGCAPAPKSLYLPDDPVWAYFNIPAPQDAPPLPDLSHLDPELDAPLAPTEPRRKRHWESESAYQARLKVYETNQVAYQSALQAYEAEKAKYEAEIQPYLDWAAKNESLFVQLEDKIQAHNGRLLGRQFSNFWINNVKERVIKEDVATDSVPGQILVGGDLRFSGHITNNQSTILAGDIISNSHNPTIKVTNNDLWGEHIIEDHGTEQWTNSHWRGGFKRYHQRDWGGVYAYTHETRKDIPLDIVKTEENSNYQKIQQNTPIANGNVTLNESGIQPTSTDSPDFTHTDEIRSIGVDTRLPSSSQYRVQADPNSHVLVETDPEFTDRRRWLSGDYMFKALRHDHENVHKRLGDGYYEQRLIREQINQLTGRMFTGEHTDFNSQYKALMDAGISFAQKFNLRLGIALSPEQVAQLTSDIVWFEPKVVTLADGNTQTVLAPRVYVVARQGDIDGKGTLIGGRNLDLHNIEELKNSGTIYGRDVTRLNATRIENSGKISGNVTTLSADKILNLGGVIEGEQATLLDAKEIDLRSTTKTSDVALSDFTRTQTNLNRQALVYTKSPDGILVLKGESLTMTGAKIHNAGQGITDIHLTGNVQLNSLETGFDEKLGSGNHYRNQASQDVVVSQISGNGQVQLRGKNIYSEGADLDAKGKLIALAENNVVLGTATRQTHYEEFHKTKGGSALSRKKTTTYDQESERLHKGTEITGDSVLVKAGQDILGESTLAVSKTGDIDFIAGNNVSLTSATNLLAEKHIKETKRSGLLNGGEIGFTIGSQKTRQESDLDGALQSTARNTLASEQGNVRVQAGNKAFASNIDVIVAKDKKATFSGNNGARMEAGKDIIASTDKYEFSQSGLSIALSTPVTDAVQAARTAIQQSKATKNDKLKGVYAVKAAEEAAIAAQNAQKVTDTLGQLGKGMEQNATATENSAVKISVSLGTQKQTRESESRSVTHIKSRIDAGNVDIISDDGKVELAGVDAKVADTLLLEGKKGIVSKGVMDTYDNKTTNKNHSASVGVFVGFNGDSYGIGIEASASVGKGKENSHSETWQNNQLESGKLVTRSDGKLTLDATNVKAEHWEGNVQDLELISRQDVTKYKSEHAQAGGSVSVTYGSGGGATFNVAYNSAKLNRAQVENQTSVDVGKGGTDVVVKGNTHLEGAVISSQADKADNRFQTGTLTTKDIQNHSELKTKSVAISGGSGGINPMSALSLLGNKNESSQSTTHSAVGENIDITITEAPNAEITLKHLNRDTENANQKVTKQDLTKVKETQELVKGIGEIAEKAMQIYTHSEREEIEQAKLALSKAKAQNASEKEIDKLTEKLNRLQTDYDKEYGTGSTTKRAVDAVIVVLQGLAAKDVGQAVVGLASPYLNEQIKRHTENADGSVNKEANLLAHAILGAVEASITGNNALAGAVAGAGGEAAAMFITNALYPNKTTAQLSEAEKKNITFLSQLVGGLASSLVGDSTQAVISGANIAKRAVENNYLAEWQKEKQEKELKECNGNTTCEVKTKLYWGLVDVGQDASFASGVVAGIPENIVESVTGLLSMVTSPVETIMAFKELLARDDTISHIADMTKQSYLDKLDKMQAYYEKAGAEGSFKAGKEIGNIVEDVAAAFTGVGAVIKTGAGVGVKIISKAGKELEIPNLAKNRMHIGTCSFRGDMEVKTEKGYQPISTIKVGDKVLAKNEITGITTYQKVQAHYSNPYDYTVYVEVKDNQGKYQTIVSNKIHPFFTQVLGGIAPISSEGHNYKGEIAKGQWVDAQHLKQGYRLLSESGEWQTVYKVTIQSEKLQAYNLTVDEDHTYFIKGTKTDSQGVWVHNDCWHALPSDAKQVENIDGYKAYQFKDPKDGKMVTVVQKDLNRFETPTHQDGVDPHFNSLFQQIDAKTGRYLSTDNPVDGLYNRSYLRSETLQKIYANYEKLEDGGYRNKLTGQEIKGPIDIGHMYGWEHRRLSLAAKELNWSQKQFNDYVNARPEKFRLENMSENRSHKNEMPGKHDIKSIIDDMEQFQKIGK